MKSEIDKLLQKIKDKMPEDGGLLVSAKDIEYRVFQNDGINAVIESENDFHLLKYHLNSSKDIGFYDFKKVLIEYELLFREWPDYICVYPFSKDDALKELESNMKDCQERAFKELKQKKKYIKQWEDAAGKKYEGEYKSYE